MNGIMMMRDGVRTQLESGLSFLEAYSMLVDLRSLKDGSYYWIGSMKEE
jgi:hypothetical protein